MNEIQTKKRLLPSRKTQGDKARPYCGATLRQAKRAQLLSTRSDLHGPRGKLHGPMGKLLRCHRRSPPKIMATDDVVAALWR